MNVQEQIKEYITSQPEPKRSDMQELHRIILEAMPACKSYSKIHATLDINLGHSQIKLYHSKSIFGSDFNQYMFNLFRPNKKLPPFDRLKSYQYHNFYFRRIVSWAWQDRFTIFIIDPNSARVITMDPWPQKIFIAADGQMTISEYVYEVAKEYRGKVPNLLDDTIINEIETLLKEKVIEIHKNKMRPEEQNDACKDLNKFK